MVSCLVGCENTSANIISNNIHTYVRTTITTITPITITTITTISTIQPTLPDVVSAFSPTTGDL